MTRSWMSAAVAEQGQGTRAEQGESGQLWHRGRDSVHLLNGEGGDPGPKSRVDRIEELICEQALSEGPGVETIGEEQVIGVITRDLAVDLLVSHEIATRLDDAAEEVVDVDQDGAVDVRRDMITQPIVE